MVTAPEWQQCERPPPPQPLSRRAFFTRLSWVQGANSRANTPVETWKGSKGKQSFTYIIEKNATMTFTWAFQRTTSHEIVSPSPPSDLWLPGETSAPGRVPSSS